MKKLFMLIGSCVLGVATLQAEQLTFITTMSAPVGAFSKVETQTSARVKNTTLYDVGNIYLQGGADHTATLGNVTLQDKSQIVSNAGQFKASELSVQQGGQVAGKSLVASTIAVNTPTDMVVHGLKSSQGVNADRAQIHNLTITDQNDQISHSGQSVGRLEWEANSHSLNPQRAGEILLKTHSSGDSLQHQGQQEQTQPSTKKRWLSPLMGCADVFIEVGALNDCPDNDLNFNECGSWHLTDSNKCSNIASSTFLQQCNLSNAAELKLLESGFASKGALACEFGSECASCIPGKKYYVENNTSNGCGKCHDEEHHLLGPGSIQNYYRVNYATCVEAVNNPYEGKTAVDCRTTTGSTMVQYGPGEFHLVDKH